MARMIRCIRRCITAALAASRPVGYLALTGRIATDLATGRLIRAGDYLDQIGGHNLPDGQRSWYGRHAKKAHIAATGRAPLTAWTRHRTTGRWIHVAVYTPTDPALAVALHTYKGTRHLTPSTHMLAA